MSSGRSLFSNRTMALVLTILMLLNIAPTNVRFASKAATEDNPDVFTIEVVDKDTVEPIHGAVVVVNYIEKDQEIQGTTDENGLFIIEEIPTEYPCTYTITVSKEQYGEYSKDFVFNNLDEFLQHNKVSLEPKLITGITIKPYNGTYDGEEHDAVVNIEGLQEGDKVTYSLDGEDFSQEIPKIKNAGTYTIYIRIIRDGYQEFNQSVEAKIEKTERTDFGFADPNPKDIEYGESFSNPASSQQSSGKITYEIVDEEGFEIGVADVDENGNLTIYKAGRIKVKATMEESTNYKESVAYYTLVILPAPRDDFGFMYSNPDKVTYGDNNNIFYNPASSEKLDGATIKYEIIGGQDVADIDENGQLTIKKAGAVTVRAWVEASDRYHEVSAEYTLEIEKADQTGFDFPDGGEYTVFYGTESAEYQAEGGQTSAPVEYEIISGADIADIDNKSGKLYFKPGMVGEIVVKAVKGGNDCYNEVEATYTLKVEYPPTPEEPVKLSGETGNSDWYIGDVTVTPAEGYEISTSNSLVENAWSDSLVLSKEGIHSYAVYLKEKETGYITDKVDIVDVKIDKSQPDSLKMEYETPPLGWILQKLTFGFYKSPVEVTIYATDDISGIESFTYSCEVEEGSSETNVGVKDQIIPSDEIVYTDDGREAMASFKIEPQFRGLVSFTATDRAGNQSVFNDDKVIVVDNVAPGVTVEYDNNDVRNTSYYNTPRTATITIEEANFDASDVYIIVGKRLEGETEYAEERIEPDFTKDGDVYTSTIEFTEDGDYTFDISYTDKSGNVYDSYETDKFTIDTKSPKVQVSYDNNYALNGDKFKEDRTATITIVERNFDAKGITVDITAKDAGGEDLDVASDYESYLKDGDNWESKGDVHSATITFSQDANYTFSVEYEDLAGNKNQGIEYEDTVVAPEQFTIDKTQPNGSIKIGKWTASVDGSLWDRFLNKITFGLWAKDRLEVSIKSHDALSGVETLRYIKVDEALSLEDVEKDDKDGWIEGAKDEHKFFVEPEEQFIIYAYIRDKAGNEKYISSDGVIIDSTSPEVEELSPEITIEPEQPINGFYNRNVKVDIKVIDPITNDKVYSGIKTVKYEVLNMGEVTQEGILYSFEKEAPSKEELLQTWSGNITVDASKNNSNDVVIKVTAYDNAGNKSEKTEKIKIDTTAPQISVIYDNNSALNGDKFNADRIATIIITERNFDPDQVNIEITNTDGVIPEVSEWTRIQGTGNGDGTQHTATIHFSHEGDYEFNIEYTDMAGNKNEQVQYGGSVAPTMFTIDKTVPVLEVSYDNNSVLNGDKFKADRTATITITEHNFHAKDVVANVTAKDAEGNDISVFDYAAYLKNPANWESKGDVHKATITFSQDANYTFAIEYKDLAGNKNESVNYGNSAAPEKFTVDKTDPKGSIQIGQWRASIDGTLWDKFLNKVTFGLWTKDKVEVSIKSNDSLSGVDVVRYFRSDKPLSLDQVKNRKDGWINGTKGEHKFTVEPDEKFIVYAHIIDKAGNDIYISSDGVIVDKTLPEIEKISPEITISPQQPVNGIYSDDVKVDIKVVDPINNSVYSGLKTIQYEVLNLGEVTQEGVLYSFEKEAPSKEELLQTWSGNITVDASKNNSNDVVIKVTAYDNAGNKSEKTEKIKIDITRPQISVTYDNNSQDPNFSGFFKEDRTATIVITERNFDPTRVNIELTNAYGSVPVVSRWSTVQSDGNGDNTRHIATIRYSADGEYRFNIECTDLAGNRNMPVDYGNSVAPMEFTIDKTEPVVTVSYDNNSASNDNYFNEKRVATISIEERNFETSRVSITMTATDDGRPVDIPPVSGWSSNGNTHTATIVFEKDALYTLDVHYVDKAGNQANELEQQIFYVDQTPPELSITGVEDKSANNGDVIPVIKYSDTNLDENSVEITLTGANRGEVALDGTYENIHNGRIFTFNNFERDKEIDDLYTLTATLMDKAGNTSTETIAFSVNRFGSTYALDSATADINGKFIQKPIDVRITETNVDALENIKVTMFKNDKSITLEEGQDYSIRHSGGNGQWNQYEYTIFKENFKEDGIYRLAVYSEDAAGNIAENTTETKSTEISFGVDKTNPNVIIADLESGITYPLESKPVTMSVSDNLKLDLVKVYLDGSEYKVWMEEDIQELIAQKEDFNFEISGDSTKAHNLKVIATDAAGNETVIDVNDFYVTTNLWVRFYNNKPLFFASTAGLVSIIAGVILLLFNRRSKLTVQEEQDTVDA